ncbi:MAG: VWA domain-containing protein, partial [Bacteroidaceae bacterium]|nr:VWA domain-containing protein [Bacteroidaceae bacterium]
INNRAMGLKDLFTKKTIVTKTKTMIETTTTTEGKVMKNDTEEKALEKIAPEKIGVLDMVIAFDTTGSMAAYIEAVRQEVAELIPNLFKDNEDLRLGIVAFGDYCDMNNAQDFGDAYQCLMPTNNENDIIKFVRESKDTSGGDGDEFYELVIKKIVGETPWREGSTRAILLISDADPHPLGYTYKDYVVGNQIDWRKEAQKAAEMKIKIDTVTIRETEWYKELSQMTNGISVPFASGHKTARLVEAATNARGSIKARMKFDKLYNSCVDDECLSVFASYQAEREKVEE